jgi:hypothetical protein
LHTEDNNLCQVITTFSTGINALNGLTDQVQYFAVGTSGTDFNISSLTDTHTFNLPTASATNRGALSSADWTTFNGKVGGSGTSGQVSYFNGTNSITSSPTFAFTPTSQLLVNNSVTAASAIARGINATPTLTAAANNDVLVGLDINPTFTNGAFTGVNNLALRVQNGNGVLSWNQNATTELNISNTTSGTNSQATLKATSSGGNIQLGKYSATTTAYKIISSNNGFIYNSTSDLAILADQGGSSIKMTANGATLPHLQIFSTGNVGISQTTDAGFRLDVNGTARVQGSTTITGSTTASGAIARGVNITSSLTAAANNDVLVGLDINPTFTNGAFTGVNNIGIRLSNVRGGFMWLGALQGNSGTGTQAYQFTTNDNTNVGTMIVSQRNASGSGTALFVQQLGTGLGLNVATGNTILGSATSTTHRLEVNGSGLFNGTLTGVPSLTVSGSITAASLAQGLFINPTLIASANNDALIGLDINPTFNNGAFTGVSNLGLRVSGLVRLNNGVIISSYGLNTLNGSQSISGSASGNFDFNNGAGSGWFFNWIQNGSTAMRLSTGNNLLIGTTADAGFKLDVNGTARVQGTATITPAANTSALVSSAYSLTGSNAQSLIDLAGTWNTTGNPTAIKLNITNTTSGANADLMELQVGGVNQFLVSKAGNTEMTGSVKTGAPSGGTAQAWKLGSVVASSVTYDPNNYVEVEINGSAYKLALAIPSEPEPLSSPDGYVPNYGPIPTKPVVPTTSEKVANLEKKIAELESIIQLLKSKIK